MVYLNIYVILDLEFYEICMFGVTNKCVSFLCDTQVLLSQMHCATMKGGQKILWGRGGFNSE